MIRQAYIDATFFSSCRFPLIFVALHLLPSAPIQPATLVVPDVLIAIFASLFRSGGGSLAGAAEEDDVLRGEGFREGEVLHVRGGQSSLTAHSVVPS